MRKIETKWSDYLKIRGLKNLPRKYEFNTGDKEIMEIIRGDLEVLLADKGEWIRVKGGEAFEVPANSTFSLKVHTLADYCCSFIK
ncbi:MAG: pyrimidine/purine nucleoside phosphorylase [Desulfobacterales bacterium]